MNSKHDNETDALNLELERLLEEFDLLNFEQEESAEAVSKENCGYSETPEPVGDTADNLDRAGFFTESESEPESEPLPCGKTPLWKRLLPAAFNVLLAAAMLVATLAFLQNNDPHKSLFGYRYYFVRSGSMEPELPIGSFILVKITPAEEIHVGDNVAFYFESNLSSEPEFWTHKVIETIRDGQTVKFQTQGVANQAPDPFVLDGENVIGRVVYCNRFLGGVMMYASQNPLPLLAVIAALFIFFHVVGRVRRNRKEAELTAE